MKSSFVRLMGIVMLSVITGGVALQLVAAEQWDTYQWTSAHRVWPHNSSALAATYYNAVPDNFGPTTRIPSQLIPTNWESNQRLIPTQIDAYTLPVQRQPLKSQSAVPVQDGIAYLNQQLRILGPSQSLQATTAASPVFVVPTKPARSKARSPLQK